MREKIIAIGLVYAQSLFVDPEWKVYSRQDREQICESGWLYVTTKPEGKFGVFVAQRQSSDKDKDFALNAAGYEHVINADREGRLAAGFIVLTENFKDVLTAAHVTEVEKKLRDTSPRNGQWGRYYWIDRNFNPVGSKATSASTAQESDFF